MPSNAGDCNGARQAGAGRRQAVFCPCPGPVSRASCHPQQCAICGGLANRIDLETNYRIYLSIHVYYSRSQTCIILSLMMLIMYRHVINKYLNIQLPIALRWSPLSLTHVRPTPGAAAVAVLRSPGRVTGPRVPSGRRVHAQRGAGCGRQ